MKTSGQILDHEYDDIHEYDNPTPTWWTWLFVVSIIFAFGYMYWNIPDQADDQWKVDQIAEFRRIFGKLGILKPDPPTIVGMMHNSEMMAVAGGIFAGNCAACHARDGGGAIGPNMTDDVYKNIHGLQDFYDVITKGANSGAMPTWENRLSMNERIILAAYAASLRGTKPIVAKAPEGDSKPGPWPQPEAKQ